MITAKLQGGLGNMLFQMAAAISLAIDLGTDYVFDISGHKCENQGRNAINYKNNIFAKIPDRKVETKHHYNELYFHYHPLPRIDDMTIEGYFQSEKYFAHNADKIRELFAYDDKKIIEIIANSNKIIEQKTGIKSAVIHIRRGDYLNFPESHPVIGADYVEIGKKLLNEKFGEMYYSIFSDDKSIDHCPEKSDFARFIFLQTFKYYIISNSSFSWWASWLNPDPEKVIIAPKRWFGPALSHYDTKDLYTEKMIVL